jgi:hypothetical protein
MSEVVTGLDVITRALQTLGVYGVGGAISGMEATDVLLRLNSLVGSWAITPGTIPLVSRTVYTLVANKGSEANPYLIGPAVTGSDFVSATVPHELEGAGILLSGATPQVEVPRAVLNDVQWASIAVKDLTSPIFTSVFYTAGAPNGEIVLWPVPDTAIHSLVLYRGEQVPMFANLSTSYTLPDGYVEALDYNLAVRVAPSYGVPVSPDLGRLAVQTLATVKRANVQMTDLENDFASGGGGYNIQTGA